MIVGVMVDHLSYGPATFAIRDIQLLLGQARDGVAKGGWRCRDGSNPPWSIVLRLGRPIKTPDGILKSFHKRRNHLRAE
jgi:hypothetical protein